MFTFMDVHICRYRKLDEHVKVPFIKSQTVQQLKNTHNKNFNGGK